MWTPLLRGSKKITGNPQTQSLLNTLRIYRKEQIGRQGTKVSLWLIEKRRPQPSEPFKLEEKTCSWRMCKRGAIGFGFNTVWQTLNQANAVYFRPSQVKMAFNIENFSHSNCHNLPVVMIISYSIPIYPIHTEIFAPKINEINFIPGRTVFVTSEKYRPTNHRPRTALCH